MPSLANASKPSFDLRGRNNERSKHALSDEENPPLGRSVSSEEVVVEKEADLGDGREGAREDEG